MLNLLLALVLGAAALAVLAFVIALIFAAASRPLAILVERKRFAAHVARATAADELLRKGRFEEALPLLLASFYLFPLRDRALSGAVANHHNGLLSRLISLASEGPGRGVRLLSLAKADRLLAERAALQKRYFALLQGGASEARQEARRRIAVNRRELEATLAQLVEEVRGARRTPTYQ